MLKWIFGLCTLWGLGLITFGLYTMGDTFAAAIDRAIRDFFLIVEIGVGFAGVAGIVVLAVWAYTRIHKRREDANRQRDGSYQLERRTMADGTELIWDITRTSSAGVAFHKDFGFRELPSPMGEKARSVMFQAHMMRSAWQAAFAGDDALQDPAHPIKEPGINSGAAKALMGNKALDKLEESPAVEPEATITYADAIAGDSPTEITMGYFEDGRVARWEPDINPHLRFHGRTRSGKSNALVSVAGAACAAGAHVVVADLRYFRNWKMLGESIEEINSNDIVAFAEALGALHAEYERRNEIIGRYNVPDFTSLPEPMVRIVFVITEFGATWKRLKDGHPAWSVVEVQLIEVLTMAGATGISVLFEDQIPGNGIWPREVSGNATPVAGNSDRNAAALVGHNAPHNLKPYTFSVENGPAWKTWDMTAPANESFLQALPPLNGYRLWNGRSNGKSHKPADSTNSTANENRWNGPNSSGGDAHSIANETNPVGYGFAGQPIPTPESHGDAYKESVVLWYMDNFGGRPTECIAWIDGLGLDISKSYVYKIYGGLRSAASASTPAEADGDGSAPAAGPTIVENAAGEAEYYDLDTEEGRRHAKELAALFDGKNLKASSGGPGHG